MFRLRVAALLFCSTAFLPSAAVYAQSAQQPDYSRRHSFGIFGEYSNNSSHILLGDAEQRKLLSFGASYSFRLLSRRYFAFQYYAELQPIILESDPVTHEKLTFIDSSGTNVDNLSFEPVYRCQSATFNFSGVDQNGHPYRESAVLTCGRRWTFGEGMSPVGVKFNFLPHHRLQPVLTGLGGYMFSTQPIPTSDAGSFNFTFEFGGGLEFYRSREKSKSIFGNRSMRAEYRYHHISNKNTAMNNPGIDNGMLQLTYSFGH